MKNGCPSADYSIHAMTETLLTIDCPDRVGLLARLTQFIATRGGNLREVHQFTEETSGWFFARMAIETKTLSVTIPKLREEFSVLGSELKADWNIADHAQPKRTVLMVSQSGHCLADLLWRWRSGDLPMEIVAVVANHETFRSVVEREGLRFIHVPIAKETRAADFEKVGTLLRNLRAELVVLARYMQIIPESLCTEFTGRIINIHHSFLPSFIGANPYKRAFERGVKLIGATCHYVTPVLDEGPIIEQEVVRVEHFHNPDDLLRLGQDCERLALARGLRYHLADRVLIHGNKTVVFRD